MCEDILYNQGSDCFDIIWAVLSAYAYLYIYNNIRQNVPPNDMQNLITHTRISNPFMYMYEYISIQKM